MGIDNRPSSERPGSMAPRARWQDVVNLILGIWLFIAPWVPMHAVVTSAASTNASWNGWVLGTIVAVVSICALSVRTAKWPEYVNAVAGLWLFIAPWAAHFSAGAHAAAVNQWVVGVVVLILALWASSEVDHQKYDTGGRAVTA